MSQHCSGSLGDVAETFATEGIERMCIRWGIPPRGALCPGFRVETHVAELAESFDVTSET
jgi:hypothetical protein